MVTAMNNPAFYTHAEWRVHPGREADFIAAWHALGKAFAALPNPPLWGTLLHSKNDPTVFYSFGPWARSEDVGAMRTNPDAQAALQRVIACCATATPDQCQCVAHIAVRSA